MNNVAVVTISVAATLAAVGIRKQIKDYLRYKKIKKLTDDMMEVLGNESWTEHWDVETKIDFVMEGLSNLLDTAMDKK
ncbi:hypothetical protein MUDCAT_29 [Arthrobacter phage Mudcat]|uniref:Uncharacterized protein n=4 Tax=Mudcatvirus TaxID=1982088 RepID=A0A222Z881_9CAUD|nr:hypothetical protein BI184_gp29 [Arthrobacter phage Mudcat]YP_010666218.1 hypothetical protein PQB76_gp031 [Arthrobacter phage Cheesy]YP_010666509.1 hypothetical protein PQB79_gp030 [Arthrobacter phage Heisenberger]YP_010666609.1 hypothetical protein PQB80_gp030 [Arthrobacter phage JEGGS]AMM44397.1 hypothetical protein MUDCAT_29 [Arthrobacter phage Mudcat]ASR80284.1 hypothetical protein SEA_HEISENBERGER_30 [Arthrobacter phage Heisenberger]ASR84611.1 hypothetical protein SEA_CHEESY_31 [Arth